MFVEWVNNKKLIESAGLVTDLKTALKILGFSKIPSREELKKTHRMLTKQYHPDLNPGFIEKFKQAQSAFEYIDNFLETIEAAKAIPQKADPPIRPRTPPVPPVPPVPPGPKDANYYANRARMYTQAKATAKDEFDKRKAAQDAWTWEDYDRDVGRNTYAK